MTAKCSALLDQTLADAFEVKVAHEGLACLVHVGGGFRHFLAIGRNGVGALFRDMLMTRTFRFRPCLNSTYVDLRVNAVSIIMEARTAVAPQASSCLLAATLNHK
jgi:hypothetical protein